MRLDPPVAGARALTVLLVDDQEPVLRALAFELRAEGHRLLLAREAREALLLLAEGNVDVLVSDLAMPDMDGMALMARARAEWPAVARILITGHASLDTAKRAINECEVHRFMTKPWESGELAAILRALSARRDERSAPAAAADLARRRYELLEALEIEHPGITTVERAGQVYALPRRRVDALFERLRACGVAIEALAPGPSLTEGP